MPQPIYTGSRMNFYERDRMKTTESIIVWSGLITSAVAGLGFAWVLEQRISFLERPLLGLCIMTTLASGLLIGYVLGNKQEAFDEDGHSEHPGSDDRAAG
jgi:hypothetical protein